LKLLILSASAGNGHISAAKAVLAEAERLGLDAHHEDCLDFTGEGFRKWYAGGYETLVRQNPALWGKLYWWSDRPSIAYAAQTALDDYFCRRLEPLIQSQKPDWILCTHSLPQPHLAKFRERYIFRVAVCVTDLYPHRMWLRGHPDLYVVPTQFTKDELARRLPWSEQVTTVTGMPVHPAFHPGEAASQNQILLTAGGISGGPIVAVAKELAGLGVPLSIVTGRNAALKDFLNLHISNALVTVHGQLTLAEMAEQMRMSAVLVGKPGGLTTFEALTSGVPMVVYRPILIPGQEEENAHYLESTDSGIIANDLAGMRESVRNLLHNRARWKKMRQNAILAAPAGAAARILDVLQSAQ
jgi:processive 1,2-diacylglycerol beta-glucosyltransferase